MDHVRARDGGARPHPVRGQQTVLLALTVVVGVLTVVPSRATRLKGWVHLALLAASVFLAINP